MYLVVTLDPACSSLITIRRCCEVFSDDPENSLNSTHRSGRFPVRHIDTLPVVSPSSAISLSHMSNYGDRVKGNITQWKCFRLGFYFFLFFSFSDDPENSLNSTHRSGRFPVRHIDSLPVSPSSAMSLSPLSNYTSMLQVHLRDRMTGNVT